MVLLPGDEPLSGCIPAFQSALIFSFPILRVPRLAATTAVVTFVAKNLKWLSLQMDCAGFLFVTMTHKLTIGEDERLLNRIHSLMLECSLLIKRF